MSCRAATCNVCSPSGTSSIGHFDELRTSENSKHVKTILENLRTLSKRTKNVDFLTGKLAEKGIFDSNIVRDIQSRSSGSESEVGPARAMYETIMKCDQRAFEALYDAIWESGQKDVAILLKPRVFRKGAYYEDSDEEAETGPYVALDKFKVRVKQSVVRADITDVVYKVGSYPKGYALIVDMRLDSCHDSDLLTKERIDLEELFCGLDYEVEFHRDVTLENFSKLVLRFRDREEHKRVDSSMVVILGDGYRKSNWNSGLYLTDSKQEGWITTDWVLEQMNEVNCPQLKGKPKVFFFQSTCAFRFNETSRQDDSVLKPKGKLNISDAIVAYASYSDCTFGRGLSHELCAVFMKKAHDTELRCLFREMAMEMRKVYFTDTGPIPLTIESYGFDRQFYFSPGLFDN